MSNSSRALNNGLLLIELLAKESEPLTISECSRRLGLPKTSVLRLLSTLEESRYVYRDDRLRYHLGTKLLELQTSDGAWSRLRSAATPTMRDLVAQSGEACHLAVIAHGYAVYVDKVDSPKPISLASRIGSRASLHASAVGKSLLASLNPADVDKLISESGLPQLTDKTITSPVDLRDHLRLVLAQGYSIDDEEEDEGVRCVGAPLFDHNGITVAALSLAGLSVDITPERIPNLANMVKEGAAAISQRLGYALRDP